MNAKRWVDAVATRRGVAYCPNSDPNKDLPSSAPTLDEYVPGDVLRVYIGTFEGSTPIREPLVTIANCVPKARRDTKERFGRAVFVGPREEAFELFYAHCRMLFGAA